MADKQLKYMQCVQSRKFVGLTREELIEIIVGLSRRVGLATEFTQSEMNRKSVCTVCGIPYHPDFCSEGVCEVCQPE